VVAYRISLLHSTELIKMHLSTQDPTNANVNIVHGPKRQDNNPHSPASVEKTKRLLNYKHTYIIANGIEEAVEWYWIN
jgi:UDP-N-acetylglucosamine 4-epimerase